MNTNTPETEDATTMDFMDIDFESKEGLENKIAFESIVTLWWNLCNVRGVNSFAYAELSFQPDAADPAESVVCNLHPIRHNNVIAKESMNHNRENGFGHHVMDRRARNISGNTVADLVRRFFHYRMCTPITPEMFKVYVTLLREEFDVITIQNGHAFKDMDKLFDFTGKVADEWCRMGCTYSSCNDITDNVAHGYGQIDFNGFWLFGISEAVVHDSKYQNHKQAE